MKKERIHSCNVLELRPPARRLWHFSLERDRVKLEKEERPAPDVPLPPKAVQKDWHHLLRPKANIAWLPPGQVFLRVVQLPAANREELLSMLEFQIEKISPLPVAHVIWSVEVLPSKAENMQTAVVCIVGREVVEAFLGEVEAAGYQSDRLEMPQLNQIVADGIREDGAWIYLGEGEMADFCTVAWWNGGTLQQIQLLRLPGEVSTGSEGVEGAGESTADLARARSRFLQEQLMQIAWAGELEGWMTLPVKWHLVAPETTAAEWEPLIREWSEEGVESSRPMPPEALARFSAERALKGLPSANLLPVEFGTRYRQQFVDRLWMGGLGAVIGIYALGVVIYIITLQIFTFRQEQVADRVARVANTYTNVLQLKEQVEVLQEQLNLKYAALDSWKVAAELLPEDFTLTWLVVSKGQTLQLQGTAPQDQAGRVTEYNEAIRGATVNGEKLFTFVSTPNIQNRPGSQVLNWQFTGDLRFNEVQ